MESDADYWLPHFKINGCSVTRDTTKAAEFQPALGVLRAFLSEVLQKKGKSTSQAGEVVARLTWHSARVTLIDFGAKNNASAQALLLQMRSTSPEMVEKYKRSRLAIPVSMINSLASEFRGEASVCIEMSDKAEETRGGREG